MYRLLLATGVALSVFGAPAFAKPTGDQRVQPAAIGEMYSAVVQTSTANSPGPRMLLAANNDNQGKGDGTGGGKHLTNGGCDSDNRTISRSKPCQGNNGFGNGGDDGTPGRSGQTPAGKDQDKR